MYVMYICISDFILKVLYIYKHTHYSSIHTHIAYMYVCVCECVYTCYIYVCARMCAPRVPSLIVESVATHTYTHVLQYSNSCISTHMCVHTNTYLMCVCVCVHARRWCLLICIFVCVCTQYLWVCLLILYMHVCLHACVRFVHNKRVYATSQWHICMHMYMNMNMYVVGTFFAHLPSGGDMVYGGRRYGIRREEIWYTAGGDMVYGGRRYGIRHITISKLEACVCMCECVCVCVCIYIYI